MFRSSRSIVFLAALVVLSCAPPAGTDTAATGTSGLISISFTDPSQTIVPSLDMDSAYYLVDGDGPGDESFQIRIEGGKGRAVDVVVGTWTLTANAYNGDDLLIGSGSDTVSVTAGKTEQAAIVIRQLDGVGTISFEVRWPESAVADPRVSATLSRDSEAPIRMTGVPGSGSARFERSVPIGYYVIAVQLSDGDDPVGGFGEAVWIVKDETTSFVYTFTDLEGGGGFSGTIDDDIEKPIPVHLSALPERIEYGERYTVIAATPESPEVEISWYLNGSLVGTGTSYLIGDLPAGTWTLTAIAFSVDGSRAGSDSGTFIALPPKYTLTVEASAGGRAAPSGSLVVETGETVSISASSDDGYYFAVWTVLQGGDSVSIADPDAASTAVAITGNAVIRATFVFDPVPPANVRNLDVDVYANSVELTWDDPGDNDLDLVKFELFRQSSSVDVRYVEPGVESLTLSGLDTERDYTLSYSTADRNANVSEQGTRAFRTGPPVQVFFAGGQSNATAAWADGIRSRLSALIDAEIVLVHAYHPGQEIATWYSTTKRANYLSDFWSADGTGALQKAIRALAARDLDYRFGGLFWFQGESDVWPSRSLKYRQRFEGMIDSLRSDLEADRLRFHLAIIDMNPASEYDNSFSLTREDIEDFRAIQMAIVDSDPNGIATDTRGIPRIDVWHPSTSDLRNLGDRMARQFVDQFF